MWATDKWLPPQLLDGDFWTKSYQFESEGVGRRACELKRDLAARVVVGEVAGMQARALNNKLAASIRVVQFHDGCRVPDANEDGDTKHLRLHGHCDWDDKRPKVNGERLARRRSHARCKVAQVLNLIHYVERAQLWRALGWLWG